MHGIIKTIFGVKTATGRAINTTAEHPYFVKLYDKELCDRYAGNAWNKEADEFNESCRRWVEVKYLEEENEIAVPKINGDNKIYSQGKPNFLANSSELNIPTLFCLLNASSSDQIAQFSFNAKAKNSLSLICGEISLASGSLSEYLPDGNVFTLPLISENDNSSSSLENLDLLQMSFQCLPISNSSQSGLTGFILSQNKISCLVPLEINEEIIGLESTTNKSIYINPFSLSSSSLSFLILLPSSFANFSASFFDSLLLEVKDFNSINFSLFDLSNSSSNAFSSIDLAINSGQLNPRDSFNSLLNSSGISIFNSAILLSPKENNENSYLKLSNSDITFEKIYSIKTLEPRHVYDLSGTRNFIANDIVAHNTYLATSSGNVGIGTTTPSSTLEVTGNFTVTGKTNSTIGNFSIIQYNSTCAGFRFGTTGGLVISCAP